MVRRANKPKIQTKKSAFSDGNLLNLQTYNDYLNRFQKIALSIFEWENLPPSMNPIYLEWCLFTYGQAALLKFDEYGFVNTMATSAGSLNLYNLPAQIHCYSIGNIVDTTRTNFMGFGPAGKEEDGCILVMNNWDRIPTLPTLELFAWRLTMAQRTADINMMAQRTPIVLVTDQDQLLTARTAYEQYNDNQPVIIADKHLLDSSSLKALNTEAPFIADKVMAYKRQLWNEFLTFLGINSLEQEKKERQIVDEAESNNEVINMNLQAMLAPRKEACRLFNLKYSGQDIDVKVRSDLRNFVKNTQSAIFDDYDGDGIIDSIEKNPVLIEKEDRDE